MTYVLSITKESWPSGDTFYYEGDTVRFEYKAIDFLDPGSDGDTYQIGQSVGPTITTPTKLSTSDVNDNPSSLFPPLQIDNNGYAIWEYTFTDDGLAEGKENIELAFSTGPWDPWTKINLIIDDYNKSPTGISLSANNFDENIKSGTVIAELSTTDGNATDQFQYTLVNGSGDADNSHFSVQDNKLVFNSNADYNSKNKYLVRIRSTDSGGLYVDKEFQLSVNEIDEDEPTTPIPGEKTKTPAGTKLTNNNPQCSYKINTMNQYGDSPIGIEGLDCLINLANIGITDKTPIIEGTSKSDYLNGTNGTEIIQGNQGNDTLNGILGPDRLLGGRGDDLYIVNIDEMLYMENIIPEIVEKEGEGIDTLKISGLSNNSSYSIPNYVENIILGQGSYGITGNGLNNRLTGNSLNNEFSIYEVSDNTIDGGEGSDTVIYPENKPVVINLTQGKKIGNPGGEKGNDILKNIENLEEN